MKSEKRLMCILAAALLVCAIALALDGWRRLPDGRYPENAVLIISEICAKNDTIIEDNTDKHRDYIELYNPGQSINLAGYTLTDGTRHSAPLGDFYLPAGGYRVIFLDNDTTGFALSSTGGDCIQLLDPYGRIVVQTSTSAMAADQVMLYDSDGTYLLSSMASPGFPNDAAGVAAFREGSEAADAPLVISEVLTRNQSVLPDENGVYADAIELYNRSGEEIQLGLYCLTDNPLSRFRFRLPDRTLAPGEYLVVFCDSLNYLAPTGEIHANFSLSVGETLMLTGPDGSHAAMDIFLTADNLSVALEGNGYRSMAPSLGYPNTEEGAALCAAATLDDTLPLAISEVLLSGAGVPYAGAFPDVVEICNISDSAVSTKGWYLSDGGDPYAYALPGEKLSPGEVMTIVCTQETTGFGLSDGETVRLTAPSRFHAPTVACMAPEQGMSIQLLDGSYGIGLPSPGYPNGEDGQLDWEKDCIPQGLMISEVMTSNQSFLRGPYATTCDWVELYNGSKETVDLSGYGLSDDPQALYMLPQILLEPGQYQIVLLSQDTRNLISGYPILPFSLAAAGEQLYLFSSDAVVDYLSIPELGQDASYGRCSGSRTAILEKATPEKENSAAAQVSAMPKTLTAQGIYNDVSSLDVVLCGSGTIYYTTDCSKPTRNSTLYTDAIALTETTVIRAICVESGGVASDILNLTYLINEDHALPVVSLVTEPNNLWSSTSGIYVAGGDREEGTRDRSANYFQDWERKANISFFELDGTGFTGPCGIKIYGSNSRKQPKKSLSVLFRGSYGLSELNYPLFGDAGVDTYESFILRAGGQDAFWSRIRDELITSIAAEHTDIAVQKYRSVVVYLNGEYFGLHHVREKISEHYVAANYNVPAETVTMAEGNGTRAASFKALVQYAATHDLSNQAYFDELGTMMDIPQYTDYIIAEICMANRDNSNICFFTYEGGKWTWILYDTDLAFIHYTDDTVRQHLSPQGTDEGNHTSTILINALLENNAYRDAFLKRMAWQINNIWSEENISAHIQKLTTQVEPVMDREFARWHNTRKRWQEHINALYAFAHQRNGYLVPYIQEYFDLSDAEMRQYGFPI